MARPLGHIRILLSSRVLLDLEDADQIFKEKGEAAYIDYVCARGEYSDGFNRKVGGRLFKPGPLFDFAVSAMKLNEGQKSPIVEIGMSCKDDVKSALPIFRNLDVLGLEDINYRLALSGKDLEESHHEAFGTDLLLTRNAKDAQNAVDLGLAAAQIHTPEAGYDYKRKQGPLRLFVDGDAVAFGSSAEVTYRVKGLEVYRDTESKGFNKEIEAGPFTAVLAKMSELNRNFPRGEQPFEITLLTARGGNAGARALSIAQQHGIDFNGGAFFMGGAAKHEVLKAQRPDLFVDDQMVHLKDSAEFCPTGLVAYATGSAMHKYQMQQQALAENKAEVTDKAPRKSQSALAQAVQKSNPPPLNLKPFK